MSTDGRQVYVASADDDTLATFARDPQTGALTWVRCLRDAARSATGCTSVAGLDGARGIVVSPDGRSVYVASGEGDALAVFQRDTSSGALTWGGCFRDTESAVTGCTSVQGLDGPHGIAVSPDGTSVYFPTETDDTVTTFVRDTSSGALTYGGCIRDAGVPGLGCTSAEGLNGARQVSVSADGSSVYVAAADDDAIVVFDRDAGTGALTWDSCTRDADRPSANGCALAQGLDGARGVASSDDGSSVYVASELDDALVVFKREIAGPAPPVDASPPTVSWMTPAANQVVSGMER